MDAGRHAEKFHGRLRLVRFGLIFALLWAGWPTLKTGAAFIQYSLWPMSAEEVQAALRARNQYSWQDPRADLRCAGAKPQWDFVCTFVYNPVQGPARVKVGVRVYGRNISAISPVHPIEARSINP